MEIEFLFSGVLVFVAFLTTWTFVSGQSRPPNFSPDAIPDTSFSCEDKITGGYYADLEADCQLFHVCVQVSEIEVIHFFQCKCHCNGPMVGLLVIRRSWVWSQAYFPNFTLTKQVLHIYWNMDEQVDQFMTKNHDWLQVCSLSLFLDIYVSISMCCKVMENRYGAGCTESYNGVQSTSEHQSCCITSPGKN